MNNDVPEVSKFALGNELVCIIFESHSINKIRLEKLIINDIQNVRHVIYVVMKLVAKQNE